MKKYIFFVLSLLISLSAFSQGIEIRRAGSGISIKDGNTTRTYPKGVGTLLEGGTLYLRTGQQIIRSIPSHTVVSVPSAASLSALQDSILVLLAPLPTISTGEGVELSSSAIQSALGYTPANASTLSATQSALVNKANTSDVNSALDLKADASTVSEIQTTLAAKANTSTVNSALALKADQTALTSGLASKANSSDVTSSLALKADASTVSALSTTVSGKADATTVNSALALKADAATMTSSLAAKANTTDVNTALDLKANTSTMNSALALKADATSVTSSLAAKADASTTTSSLALKADQSALTSGLAGKADVSALTSGLAGKVGTTGDETIAGLKTFSALQSYRAAWSGGQGIFGSTGQAGRILFSRSSDGAGTAWVGFRSAGENNSFGMTVSGGSGAIDLATAGGAGLKVFSDSRVTVKRGGTHVNNGTHDFQVDGSQSIATFLKVGGGINFNPDSIKTFATNADALAGGVAIGKLYKTEGADGEWNIKMTHPVSLMPIYSEVLGNLITRTLFVGTSSERKYKSQKDPLATWGITKSSGGAGIPPVFRFELRPGDVWPTDTVNGNDQNGNWKERAEMYDINPTTSLGYNTPWESVQWVAYRMFIEPGGDVVYGNTSYYCDLGQWHAKTGGGQATIKIDFSGQTLFRFYTHGGTSAGSGTLRYTTNLARGTWHNIVMRIKHSNTAGQGEFRLYINNATPVVNLTGIDLGIRGESDAGYWKYGIYRTSASEGQRVTLAVHYANMEISTSDLSSRATSPLGVVP